MQLFPRPFERVSRPVAAILAVLALIVAEIVYVGLGPARTAVAATPGQGSAFDCTGGTIYASQNSTGTIYALDTTNFGATVPATAITTVPSEANPNAFGLTLGGADAYVVSRSATGAAVNVYKYDPVNQSWQTFIGTATSGDIFVAGAVDPFSGIYYYANYNSSGKATVYGFDTNTDTAIPGIIATISLPIASGTVNGDMAFDLGGNLYVVESSMTGTAAATGVVRGPLPATGTNTALSATTLNTYTLPGTQGWNGIAFDNSGQLFVEYTSGTTTNIQGLNPNTGATINAATPEDLSGSDVATDLAACSLNPTLTVKTNLAGRSSSTDQFGMSVTGGGITQGNTATTSGNSNGVQAAQGGPVIGVSGTTYAVAQTAASGSLSNYTTTYSCTDAAAADRVVASGSGTSFALPFPNPAAGATGPYVTCTFTDTPTPASLDTVKTLKKINGSVTAGGDTVKAGDVLQYALKVTNSGGSSGTTTLSDTVPVHTSYTGSAEGWSCATGSPAGTSCTQSVTAGPNASVTKNYTVTVGTPVGAANISNTATSSVGTCSACTATNATASSLDTTEALTSVNGDTSATASTPLATGDVVVYTDTITNSGGTSDTVTLTQTVPASTNYTGTGEGWSCSATTPGSTCTKPLTVGAGLSQSAPFTVTVGALPPNKTTVSDAVSASAGSCSACTVSNPTVAVLDTVKTIFTVNGNPATSSTQLAPGDVVIYRDTVTNTGGSAATTTLSDTVPVNTAYTGSPTQGWSCVAPADAGTGCTQSVAVASGSSVTTDYTVTVNDPLPAGTQSIASAVSTGTGTCSACSVSNATVAVLDTVETILSVNGSAATSATQLSPGDTVIYRDTTTNSGGSSATTVLTESVPAHTTFSGAVGEGWSCTAPAAAGTPCTQSANVPADTTIHRDYTVTVDNPLASGTLAITSTVTSGTGTCSACSMSNPTVAVFDTVKAILTVDGNPADSTTDLAPGDVVVYRDTVTNTGGSSGSTLLTDTVPAATTYTGAAGQGWSCSSGAPAGTGCVQSVGVGANSSARVDFTVTVADPIPTGTQSITSTVGTGTGTCSACTVVNATVAHLDTTKILVSVNGQPADPDTQIKQGDVLVYSVTVTNTGGTAGSTTVTDIVPDNTTYTGNASEGWSCPSGAAAGTSCTQSFTVAANSQQATTYTVTVGTLPTNTTTVANPVTTSNGSCSLCDGSNPTVGALASTLTLATVNGSPADANTKVKAGDVLRYQIATYNGGGSTGSTTLSNPVPSDTTYTGAAGQGWSCAAGSATGTSCTQDVTVGAGATVTVGYTVTLANPLPDDTTEISDGATSSPGSCDCAVQNTTVAVLSTTETIVSVNGQAATANTPLKATDVVVYEITVANTGGTSAGTTVTDRVPANATYTGTGEGWSCIAPAIATTSCTQPVTVGAADSVDLTYTVTIGTIPTGTTTIRNPISTSPDTCATTAVCTVRNPTVAQLATVKKLSKINGDTVDANSTPALRAGDVAIYTITVTNNGGSDGSTGLTETVPANTTYTGTGEGWTCAGTGAASECTQSVDNLAKLSSTNVSFTVTVSNLPLGTQQIENSVLSSAGTCSCTVDTATFAALDTVKTLTEVNGAPATSATRLTAGDVADYQITVTNTGGSTGTTTLLETVPDNTSYTGTGENWNCASGTCAQDVTVTPFSSVSVTFTVTVDKPLAAGTQQIVNTVVSSVGACSACTVTSQTVGVLDTVKVLALVNGKASSAAERVKGGDVLGYAVAVINRGGSPATTTLTETVPKGTLFLGKPVQGWSCVAPAVAGTQCTQTVQVQQGAIEIRAFTIGVKGPLPATSTDVVNVVTTSAGTCSVCRVSTPLQHADVVVTKTADSDTALVGDLVHFTVRAHNNGPDAATDLVVMDTPHGMQATAAKTAGGAFYEKTGMWHIGTLASGDTVVLHTTDRITSQHASNAANAFNPTQVDSDPANGVASVSVHKDSSDLPTSASNADLASTGVPTENLVRLASLMMLIGIGALVLGRRRYRGRRRA